MPEIIGKTAPAISEEVFLQRILQHPTFEITALVCDAGKAQLLETKFGVKAVVGSMEELDKLTELAEKAHIVVHVANADDDSTMTAILAAGLRKRHEKTGDVPNLIRISGVGPLADGAGGEYASERVVSDLDIETFDALPANSEGYVRTYLVLFSAVVGYGEGPLYDAGISKRPSILVPLLADIAAKRGRPGVMGTGKNIWAIVHVEDNADLTYSLFSAALTGASKLAHGREGYYLTENGEVTLYEVCKAMGTVLVAEGVATEAEPTEFTPEERVKRDLGWTPKYPKEEIWKEVADVVKELANKVKVLVPLRHSRKVQE